MRESVASMRFHPLKYSCRPRDVGVLSLSVNCVSMCVPAVATSRASRFAFDLAELGYRSCLLHGMASARTVWRGTIMGKLTTSAINETDTAVRQLHRCTHK